MYFVTDWEFQSTLPAWGSDFPAVEDINALVVSIHAPRVGERRPG